MLRPWRGRHLSSTTSLSSPTSLASLLSADRPSRARATSPPRAAIAAALAVACAGCGSPPIALHAPSLPPTVARSAPTTIDLEPIATPRDRDPEVPGKRRIAPPGPAQVLTGGIAAELRARALRGGEPGGYGARCTLDRFAIRTDTVKSFLIEVVYVDLACEVRRKADRALVWRGELRGRSGAIEAERVFATDDAAYQALADRLLSDVSREIASDLALSVLGLEAGPSKRVFANEEAEREGAGIDDGALGSLILAENEEATRAVVPQLRDGDPLTRAAAWNAVAMAGRPDGAWITGIETTFDDDAFVRLFQYKAFARQASPAALSDLRRAQKREDQTFLEEFLRDALAAGTLGVKGGAKRPAAVEAP